jgi:hypothetical protein
VVVGRLRAQRLCYMCVLYYYLSRAGICLAYIDFRIIVHYISRITATSQQFFPFSPFSSSNAKASKLQLECHLDQ